MLALKERDGLGLEPRTVINTHRVLSGALKQAVKWRMLTQNVCQYVDLPKQQKKEMQALSQDEAGRFLEAARSDRFYVLFAVMLGTGLRPGEALIFPSMNDTPLNGRNVVNRHFKPMLEVAGLSKTVRFYDLRHTHATLLLKVGVHPKIVSERLGHSSITLTLDTYSHVLPGMQDEAADKLDAMLFPQAVNEGARAYN